MSASGGHAEAARAVAAITQHVAAAVRLAREGGLSLTELLRFVRVEWRAQSEGR